MMPSFLSALELAKYILIYEPPHDKTNKMTVRQAKTPISLGIRPVLSESAPLPSLIRVFAGQSIGS